MTLEPDPALDALDRMVDALRSVADTDEELALMGVAFLSAADLSLIRYRELDALARGNLLRDRHAPPEADDDAGA